MKNKRKSLYFFAKWGMFMNKDMYFKIIRAITVIFTVVSLYLVLKFTFMYIYPFLFAFIIAFMLHPTVTYIETHWNWHRTVATLFIMCSFFIVMTTSSYFLLKHLINESMNLVDTLPEKLNQLKIISQHIEETFFLPIYEKLQSIIPTLPMIDEFSLYKYIEMFIDEIGQSGLSLLTSFVGTASNIVSSITYIFTIFAFMLIATFMMTKDFDYIKEKLNILIPYKMYMKLQQMKLHMKKSVFGLMKAQILITFISTFIVFVGFIFFRVENIFMTTLIIFFVDFIPYIGVGAVFIPWILYQFFTEQFMLTVQLSILYIIVIIVRQVLEPKILASSIGIHPLIALFILFIGIQSFGIVGIFITPIIFIFISAIYHTGIIHMLWKYIKDG